MVRRNNDPAFAERDQLEAFLEENIPGGIKRMDAQRRATQRIYGDQTVAVDIGGKEPHVVFANSKDANLNDVARGVLQSAGINNPDDKQVAGMVKQLVAAGGAAGLGDDKAALMDQLRRQHTAGFDHQNARNNGMIDLLLSARKDGPFRQKLAATIGLDGPDLDGMLQSVADGLGSADEKVRAGAESQVAQIQKVLGSVIKPEVNDWASQPVGAFKDLPVMQSVTNGQMAMAAATGAGAASVILANQLMAKGQQQNDPVAYAAAMQSMNAY